MRLAAVAGNPFGAQLQPDDLLLGDGDPVDKLAGRKQVAAAEAAFVDHVLGVELRVVIGDHPARAEGAADLLVGFGEQNHVARERHPLTLQPEERQDLRYRLTLHVDEPRPHNSLP